MKAQNCKLSGRSTKESRAADTTIEGNLIVKGCIVNPTLDFLRDSTGPIPPSDEIYNQWQLFFSTEYVLQNVQEDSIPTNSIVPGTQPSPGSLIYGYDDDQTLDVEGGVAKS